jgi:myo-inositol-1(or 4)-monophosphatase
MNIESICHCVCDLSRQVGKRIRSEVTKLTSEHLEVKGLHNYVTYVDKMSEQMLAEGLGELLPEAGFLAEEGTVTKHSDRLIWVIDPLDGTTNFIHSLPIYSISIALMDREELLLGVVYEINQEECFYAWKDGPAFMNGNIIHVSDTTELNNSLLATGFPYTDYGRMEDYLRLLGFLLKESRGLRRFGSAAVDMAYVACGRFDGFYEYGLNPWDVAAGALIVSQAGGKVSDFSGNENFIYGKEIIASNDYLHNFLRSALGRYFV